MGLFRKTKGPHGSERWVSASNRVEITNAQAEGRDAVYHGACLSCVWQKGNAVGEGLRWCMGCAMFDFVETLPNRRVGKALDGHRAMVEAGYDG